jgi:hypothetical protein
MSQIKAQKKGPTKQFFGKKTTLRAGKSKVSKSYKPFDRFVQWMLSSRQMSVF